jgi:hypothetical protein
MFKTESECPDCIVRRVGPDERDDDVTVVVKLCSFHMDSGKEHKKERGL